MPTQDGHTEPDITINGRQLTFAECMTVRVAVSAFIMQIQDPKMREGLGERLAAGYEYHLTNVARAMIFLSPV